MIKLVAIDLDGTLLNDEKGVDLENIKAIQRVKSLGIKVVICTGRPLFTAKPIIDLLGPVVSEDYLIIYNGAVLYRLDQKKLIYQKHLSLSDLKFFKQLMDELDMPLNALTLDTIYESPKIIPGRLNLYRKAFPNAPFEKKNFDDFSEDQIFLKFVVTAEASFLKQQMARIPRHLWDDYSICLSHPFQLEVMAKGVSKSRTLKRLGDYLSISMKEVLALGDQLNDMDLLQVAGIGVAMENADDRLKEIADFVTKSNNQAGVAYALDHFI